MNLLDLFVFSEDLLCDYETKVTLLCIFHVLLSLVSVRVTEQFQVIKITLPLFNVSLMQCYHIGNYVWHVFIYVSLLLSPL